MKTIREYMVDGETVRITIDYEGVLAADLGPALRAGDTLHATGQSTFAFRDWLIAQVVEHES